METIERVRLRWRDGRVTEITAATGSTEININYRNGTRSFRATEEIDRDGFPIFVEEAVEPDA